ncbi:MAG: RNA polymerase sigma factor [bacterium]
MKKTERITDVELVRRIEEEGDDWNTPSVTALYRKYFGSVYCFALQRVKNPEAAQDIRQDTLTAVIEAIKGKKVKDAQNLSGFVRGVCRNKVMHFLGQEERVERLNEMEDMAEDRGNELQRLVAEEEAEILDNKKRAVQECIKRLNQSRQNILILYFYENLSTAEIARRMGITTGNARKRKHDALAALKKCLKRKML